MSFDRPIVLSIAGFDPTGGAGVLADVKTCEQNNCLGFSVLTANTIQTEDSYQVTHWIDIEIILNQLKTLFLKYKIACVKIGIVENLAILQKLIHVIKNHSETKIIWDPIVASSTGHFFLSELDENELKKTLQEIDLITPNRDEVKFLAKEEDEMKAATYLAQFCAVYLKGGHSSTELGVDFLFEETNSYKFLPKVEKISPKHGSGCILSTAIACNLAKGKITFEACKEAKNYIEKTLGSNEYLLAYHHV